MVAPRLFAEFCEPAALARAKPDRVETIIRSTGFYRQKARSILRCAVALVERHQGRVPELMEDLTALPGVGRKTANVIRGNALGKPAIIVDTHVKRIVGRLGLTQQTNPDKIEFELRALLDSKDWTPFSNALIWHGRNTCTARRPDCPACPVRADCPYGQTTHR